ncbi:CBS domain-containing protein [Paraburkholderia sp. NMBU_R16]|uniref:CBS domain-containing protein n=1 Tax=Paraburkholderia sp. NMBU_R16 TaxID=2698676 RepID=UPI001564D369|nr:CBS domain-containing protein [Paraburkholderia sp. NMBU_R16]NRO98258.1 CBS domain-containing protein [Paraburkholderia sp. NMBU_R16]
MRALDIMTSPVVTASPGMTTQAAAKLLADNHISGAPVVDAAGRVVGIVSEGDLLRRAEIGTGTARRSWWLELLAGTRELAAAYVKEHGHVVGDVMNDRVISIGSDMPLKEIADVLERNRIKRVPVLDGGKLVGIVSRANLIRALASVAPADDSLSARNDTSIRDAIVREMSGTRWALSKKDVIVMDGVAHLWGVIESEEEKRAIRITAEAVPGVKEVVSHLTYPPIIPAM